MEDPGGARQTGQQRFGVAEVRIGPHVHRVVHDVLLITHGKGEQPGAGGVVGGVQREDQRGVAVAAGLPPLDGRGLIGPGFA